VAGNEEEAKVEQQVVLVEPSDFQDGTAYKALNSSLGVITHSADLHSIVNSIRALKGTD
jgi:phosphohistidine swiveling domain-containing protein